MHKLIERGPSRVAFTFTALKLEPPLRHSLLSSTPSECRPQAMSAVVAGGRCRDGLKLSNGPAGVFVDFGACYESRSSSFIALHLLIGRFYRLGRLLRVRSCKVQRLSVQPFPAQGKRMISGETPLGLACPLALTGDGRLMV